MFKTDWNKRLLKAAKKDDIADIEKALSKGADINVQNGNGATPLRLALENWHENAAEFLLTHNADPNIERNNGATPLTKAAAQGLKKSVLALLKAGAQIDQTNAEGDGPLRFAVWNGEREIVNILLEAGADPNKANNQGATPLTKAAAEGYIEIVKDLLAAGADPNAYTNKGTTALGFALQNGHNGIVAILEDKTKIKPATSPAPENPAAANTEASEDIETDSFHAVNEYIAVKYEGEVPGIGAMRRLFNFKTATVTTLMNDTPGTPEKFEEFQNNRDEILTAYNWMVSQGYDQLQEPEFVSYVKKAKIDLKSR